MPSTPRRQTFLTFAGAPSDSSQHARPLRYSAAKPTMPTKRKRPVSNRCAPCYYKRLKVCDPQQNPQCKLTGVVTENATTADNNNSTIPAPQTANPQSTPQPTGAETLGIPTGNTQNDEYTVAISAHDSKTFNVGDRSILNVTHGYNKDAPDMQFGAHGSNTAAFISTSEQQGSSGSFSFHSLAADASSHYPTATGANLDLPSTETYTEFHDDTGAANSLLFGKPATTEQLPGVQNANDHGISGAVDIAANTTSFSSTAVERLLTPDASSLSSVPLTPAPDAMETDPAAPGDFSSKLAMLDQQYQPTRFKDPSPPPYSIITTDEVLLDAPDTRDEAGSTGDIPGNSDSVRDVATLTDDALTGYNFHHGPLQETGLNALVGQMCQEPESAGRLLLGCMDEYMIDVEALRSKIHAAGLDLSFCEARWKDIAPRMGLLSTDDEGKLPTFRLEQARLHNDDFNLLVKDLNRVSLQYGLLPDAESADVGSRIFQTYINNIVALFGGLMLNNPESILDGLSTTKGRGRVVHQFSTYGKVNLLFIEVMKGNGDPSEKLDFFAQAIAELEARSWQNSQLREPGEPDLPIVAILTDATALYFFQLSHPAPQPNQPRPRPTIRIGKFDYPSHQTHIPINCSPTDTLEAIVRNTRAIANTLYFVFLRQFHHAVRLHLDWTLQKAMRVGGNAYRALPAANWGLAKDGVKSALDAAIMANRVHEDGQVDYAGRLAWDGAMTLMKSIMDHLPNVPTPFMAGYTADMARL